MLTPDELREAIQKLLTIRCHSDPRRVRPHKPTPLPSQPFGDRAGLVQGRLQVVGDFVGDQLGVAQIVAVFCEETRLVAAAWDDGRAFLGQLGPFVGHFEEQEERNLFRAGIYERPSSRSTWAKFQALLTMFWCRYLARFGPIWPDLARLDEHPTRRPATSGLSN